MKNIILILLVVFSIQCKAQTPEIDLQAWNGKIIPNMYLKDTNFVLNPFEGTWLYTNGTTSLKIVLVKKEMKRLGRYYEDIIIGEYQYIENGVVKFNSLNDLNTIYPNEYYHNIVGNFIPYRPSPFTQVVAGEVRLEISFHDNAGGKLHIRKTMVGSQQAIQIFIFGGDQPPTLKGTPDIIPIVPRGTIYTLIKQ